MRTSLVTAAKPLLLLVLLLFSAARRASAVAACNGKEASNCDNASANCGDDGNGNCACKAGFGNGNSDDSFFVCMKLGPPAPCRPCAPTHSLAH